MVDKIENKKQEEQLVVIREFNQERDIEVVGKLEKNCEIDMLPGWSTNNNNIIINSNNNNKKRVSSLLTNMMADPLCRIRLYAVHVMLVGFLSYT